MDGVGPCTSRWRGCRVCAPRARARRADRRKMRDDAERRENTAPSRTQQASRDQDLDIKKHTCVYIYVYTCVYIYIYVYVCMYIYIYMYVYIYIYIHTYMFMIIANHATLYHIRSSYVCHTSLIAESHAALFEATAPQLGASM